MCNCVDRIFQERDNQRFLSMVKRVLATPGFYYSNTYDLTHSLQRKHHLLETKPQFSQLSLFERADERFVWNSYLLRDFVVQPELRRFIIPMIHGFVSITSVEVNSRRFTFVLISRRSALRAGDHMNDYTSNIIILLCSTDSPTFTTCMGHHCYSTRKVVLLDRKAQFA